MTFRLRATTGLACVSTVVLLLVGCGGGDEGAVATVEPISLEQLTSAASTSADAPSGRFAFSMEASFPGTDEPLALSGEGAFDAASDRGALSVDFSSFAKLLGGLFGALAGPDAPDFDDPDAWQIDVVQIGEEAYVRFPVMADQLPDGKSWVRGEYEGVGAQGIDLGDLEPITKADPREMLGFLRGVSGEIQVVGTEELRGVDTTHYRATVDPAEFEKLAPESEREQLGPLVDEFVGQSGIGEVPVDVWIDAEGMVRKVVMSFTATQPGSSETAESTVSFELWDYGEPVAIEPPPASEVADASTLKKK
jgi:hypothetical protein